MTPASDPDGAIRAGEPMVQKPWPYKHEPASGLGCNWLFLAIFGMFGLAAFVVVVLPVCMQVNEAVRRAGTIGHMKEVVIACHNYHDIHKKLPPPKMVVGKDGEQEVNLSWRVAILPFMDQDALHNSFDLNAGWNGAGNKELQNRMPPTYTCPTRDETENTRTTHMQYFTGPGTLFPNNGPLKLGAIPDTSSLYFAEADRAVVWSQPVDMGIRGDQPLPLPTDLFFGAMVDGSVRSYSRASISDAILRQLIDPNDGKPDPGWDR
ncbi:MAG: DUF1559 domain-containing protein [Planctomycetes bacterium]|nr:DUF1559 domain-containing protein [Planctomycetota bacterium]